MKLVFLFFPILFVSNLFGQKKEIEITQIQNGNEITFFAKNEINEILSLDFKLSGSGFTTSQAMPINAELKPFEKKELAK